MKGNPIVISIFLFFTTTYPLAVLFFFPLNYQTLALYRMHLYFYSLSFAQLVLKFHKGMHLFYKVGPALKSMYVSE